MNLLLDTHVVLWWLTDDPTLSDAIKEMLDHEPGVYVSAATIWEIAIKQSIGKLAEPGDLLEEVRRTGFLELPIGFDHAIAAGRLPLIHKEPFYRMLVAQPRSDNLPLLTRDPHCNSYYVDALRA